MNQHPECPICGKSHTDKPNPTFKDVIGPCAEESLNQIKSQAGWN